MTPTIGILTLVILIFAIVFDNAGLAALAVILAFMGG